jgi:hypothetical protein
MTLTNHSHLDAEILEQYAMGRLSDDQAAECEEHLLFCHSCQDRLEEFDRFLLAMRQVVAQQAQPAPGVLERLRQWASTWVFAKPSYGLGAVAAAVLAIVLLVPGQRDSVAGSYAITLDSTRGESVAGVVSAPASHRLHLTLDLRGVPAQDRYLVTIVDTGGTTVHRCVAEAVEDHLVVTTEKGLRAGEYWVRISAATPSEPLLREFGLQIKSDLQGR